MKHFSVFYKHFITLLLLGCLIHPSILQAGKPSTVSGQFSSPEYVVPTDLFPSNGKYETPAGSLLTFPSGIQFRYMGNRDFSSFDTLPALGGGWKIYNFNSTMDFEISLDGGATWAHGFASSSNNIALNHIADTGATRYFDIEILSLMIAGGTLPPGFMMRESPTLASPGKMTVRATLDGGYMISSFFDIFLEVSVDGGSSWAPGSSPMRFENRYPTGYSLPSNLFPPPTSRYQNPGRDIMTFTNGILLKNYLQNSFSASVPPPPPGSSLVHSYNEMETFEISYDGGMTWNPVHAPGTTTTRMTWSVTDGLTDLYSTEFLSLSIAGGTLPPGYMIRESPTRSSTGQYTTMSNMLMGYTISSFFDIFTEISLDGGMSWSPSVSSFYVELVGCATIKIDPAVLTFGKFNQEYTQQLTASGGTAPYQYLIASGSLPSGLGLTVDGLISGTPTTYGEFSCTIQATDFNGCLGLQSYTLDIYPKSQTAASDYFPPNGKYVNRSGDAAIFPAGIIIKKIVHRELSHIGAPPPSQGSQLYSFTGNTELEISFNQGATWQNLHAPSFFQIGLTHTNDEASSRFFQADIVNHMILGGDLPPGVMLRESPTIPSTGKHLLTEQPVGRWTIDSFFDIFYEISFDGGQTWSPSLTSVCHALAYPPECFLSSDVFPPAGKYKSKTDESIYWLSGIWLRNITMSEFTQSFPLPTPGNSGTHSVDASLQFDLSLDGGLTWNPVTAIGNCIVQISNVDEEYVGRFFNTEILALNISGGSLPPFVIFRESPTRASSGRHNVRTGDGNFGVSSFFDVFLEMTLDGGQTWSLANNLFTMQLSQSSLSIPVDNGWNMVSVPLVVDDPRKTTLFPSASSYAFTYDGTYIKKDSLEIGIGYWLKFPTSQTVTITGEAITTDTVDVNEGWNMIGSLSETFPITNITSIPGGIITSQIFGYNRSYSAVDTIRPGLGYWVKVSENGKIILSIFEPLVSSNRISIKPTEDLPPSPPDHTPQSYEATPKVYRLNQNYPNPFNPSTIINYQLPSDGYVTLKIYNVFGQEVRTLVDGMQDAGYKSVEFSATNLASGIYYYKLTVGSFVDVKKMILIR